MFEKILIGSGIGAIAGYALSASGLSIGWLPSGYWGLDKDLEELIILATAGGAIGLALGIIDR